MIAYTKPENQRRKDTASFALEYERAQVQRPFTCMIKLPGPVCNLDCDYCYYLEKDALYADKKYGLASFRMREDVLERLIRDYIRSQPQERVEFIWHGGEPTLVGLDYFRKILALQQQYGEGKVIANVLQTNGTLIDDRWAEFLAEHHFLCGLSVDGPAKFHDRHRRFPDGRGSLQRVLECARLFRKHGVEFNTMSVVNASNCKEPVAVYEFLRDVVGSRYMQFTPIVERVALDEEEPLSLVAPAYAKQAALMEENVGAEEWGNFLCRVFDRWVKTDVAYCYVNWFDNTLAAYVGEQPSLCSMASYCACALAIEHNGDAYCCDHFVFPDYRLGNVLEVNIAEMAKSDKQLLFEQEKKDALSALCLSCPYLRICGGDCPKNRIDRTPLGEPVSCLCKGFRMFFEHTQRYFEFMAEELRQQRPPANVMKAKL